MSTLNAKTKTKVKAKSARPDYRLRTITADEPSKSQRKAVQPRRKSSNPQGKRSGTNLPAAQQRRSGTVQEPSDSDQTSQPKAKIQPKKPLTGVQTCAEDESARKKTTIKGGPPQAKPKVDKVENKKKPGKVQKCPDAIPLQVEEAVQDFVAYHTNIGKVSDEWEQLATQTVMEEQKHKACCENKDRNRYPEEVHCLDSTRIILKNAAGGEGEFYHANKCRFDGADRDYILAQAPMQNTAEAFWKMVFQEQSPTIVVLCDFYENGKEASMPFYPTKSGEYKYYGTMFVNNKKKETTDKMTSYTIEVLPDGCSNSHITVLYHYVLWPPGRGTRASQLLDMRRLIKPGEAGPMTVVSSRGTGRAAAFVAIDIILIRLFKGIRTRLVDIIQQMRKQRAGSLSCMFHYFDTIDIVLHYLQAKIKKHRDSVQKYRLAVHSQLKKCHEGDEKKDSGKCCNKDEKLTQEDPSSCG